MLVCVAIIAALSALLFPVFQSAKGSALEASCLSRERQISLANALYLDDYDDRFTPVRYRPGSEDVDSRTDRTWVQLLLPYVRTFGTFKCPSDQGSAPADEASFDKDLVPGDTYSRFYSSSLRSNAGLNYLYLSPIEWRGGAWTVNPRSLSGIEEKSKMILTADSVWDRSQNGSPTGGGTYIVIPPCRYRMINGFRFDTFPLTVSDGVVLAASQGWKSEPNSGLRYGGAWPWHGDRLTVAYVDGSARSVTPGMLSAGCEVEKGWGGAIADSGKYLWDAL